MPKAKNRFERADQILAWLQHEFPADRGAFLRWRAELKERNPDTGKIEQIYAISDRVGRDIEITLSRRMCRTWELVAETLIHEYVHVLDWGMAHYEHVKEHHPLAFYLKEAEIRWRWYEDHGCELSKEL